MNDPGADEPIARAAHDVEADVVADDMQHRLEEEQAFFDPSRWWFASTACPLIAGTFGPMANAFSVCALVENWRVSIPPGADEGHGEPVKDPAWLIAINSVSLAFALMANLSLLLNMARRVSFAVAQPVTIVGWFLASVLLIVLVALASTSIFRIAPAQAHALSQAYYYGIIAAALYGIVASLMVLTVVGAYTGHYPKEFRLSASQRTLMLQTISFMFYLLLGALVYTKIEGWQFLDAVYWADFTLLTIGVGGEYVPQTHIGRGLLFPYAIGGIVMVGLVVGSIRSLALERSKEKLSARLMEKSRRRVLSSINKDKAIRLSLFHTVSFSEKGLSETQRREQEFRIMRRIHREAEKKRRYISLVLSTIAAFLLWFLGALVFQHSEKPQGWSYFASLYFAYTSLLTIGYGDLTLSSNSSKPFFVFWSLLAVPTLTILISNMSDTIIKTFRDLTIWLGSVTILPGEYGALAALKHGLQMLQVSHLFRDEDHGADAPGASGQAHVDLLAKHLEDEELAEAEQASEHGDVLERDVHFYHYILTKELRKLMRDTEASPPRQYTYQEWTYYLRLLGQNEADSALHRRPRVEHATGKHGASVLGAAGGGGLHGEQPSQWSWLGIRSPLMGTTSEAQWLLLRVAAVLERQMSKMRSPAALRNEPPPVSMAELRATPSRGAPQDAVHEKELSTAELRRRQPDMSSS